MLLITTNLGAFGVDTSLRDVGFVNKYMIDTNGQNFEVTFTANFEVSSHTFSTDDKMLPVSYTHLTLPTIYSV